MSAESEDIRQIAAAATQVAAASSPTGQKRARVTPRNVATPLPPRNFSQTGKTCPRNAPSAAATTSVAAAAHFFPVRSTLVAPILPEPILRTSPAPASQEKIRPKGIEPNR